MLRAQRMFGGVLAVGLILAAGVAHGPHARDLVLGSAFLVWWLSLAALNQFSIDRSAYWMNVAAGGDPRDDLIGKNIALALVNIPVFIVVALGLAAVTGGWTNVPVATANAAGLLAVEFAFGNITSVRLAQPAPESTMNLWASRPGRGCGTAALMILAVLLNLLLVSPVAALVGLGVSRWRGLLALSVPVSLAYGGMLYWIGLRIASSWIRIHQAELLEELSPRQV
jgi:ABC-2 type transport system permease protein